MRALKIIVEGQTEKEFVGNCITPYLSSHGIFDVKPITLETSPGHKGGDIRYARYKPDVKRLLYGKEDMLVTSLIDFYGLKSDFPGYEESKQIVDVKRKVAFLEQACAEDIADGRFIPYIQLHEFEGLLFVDERGFNYFPNLSSKQKNELVSIIKEYPDPELINDNPTTAPSKRLKQIIPEYQKTLYGTLIACENGFDRILEKCPRFRNWMETLIRRMKE